MLPLVRWNFELDAKPPLKMRKVSALFSVSLALPVETVTYF